MPIILCVGRYQTWNVLGRPGRFISRPEQALGIGLRSDKVEIWVFAGDDSGKSLALAHELRTYMRGRVDSVVIVHKT